MGTICGAAVGSAGAGSAGAGSLGAAVPSVGASSAASAGAATSNVLFSVTSPSITTRTFASPVSCKVSCGTVMAVLPPSFCLDRTASRTVSVPPASSTAPDTS
ncbi:hypothetical protein EYF88_03860 [Paracoccus sediminis]|uniref:Secreted protein n=1 Tax=Paracoccus sediminis TaxID=1214787 RepID=A0ABY1YL15_9RHOB|nr:hypothetical protein EYF88_03860 [Paracoccus sediminis]